MEPGNRGEFRCHPEEINTQFYHSTNVGYWSELARRKSFPRRSLGYTEETVNDLARYGFYWQYDRSALGRIVCIACHLEVLDFYPNDLAAKVHIQGNFICPFFDRKNNTKNILAEPSTLVILRQREIIHHGKDIAIAKAQPHPFMEKSEVYPRFAAKFSSYKLLHSRLERVEERKKTFPKFWPYLMPIDDLARYGFICKKDKDKVECEYCGLQIKYWQQGDLAAIQHKIWSPLCDFLLSSVTSDGEMAYFDERLEEEEEIKEFGDRKIIFVEVDQCFDVVQKEESGYDTCGDKTIDLSTGDVTDVEMIDLTNDDVEIIDLTMD
jgi:hypothetical protein